MPLPLVVAIVLAFWTTSEPTLARESAASSTTLWIVGQSVATIVGLFGATWSVGLLVSGALQRPGPRLRRVRNVSRKLARLISGALVGAYAWILLGAGWGGLVNSWVGSWPVPLVDELLLLLPFLVAQVLVWWGWYPAEEALGHVGYFPWSRSPRITSILRKARQSFGLVLPVALIFALGQDLIRISGWNRAERPWIDFAMLGGLSILILAFAPAFVRLAWPMRPMEPGPLRERLEQLARRCGFRYSEILVWDTGYSMANAGVTGALPWFRYVLLTDSLIEQLSPHEIEAVFGHEVGHSRHRHLAFFGAFFLGSVGLIALVTRGIERGLVRQAWYWPLGASEWGEWGIQLVAAGGFVAVYFLLVFGYLSRRFERQADVYGCRAISCGPGDACPPHRVPSEANAAQTLPCPGAVRQFCEALENVALLNGLNISEHSWRHGSIARRLGFLRQLEAQPAIVRSFERRLLALKLGLLTVLGMTTALAWHAGALGP